MKLLTEVGALTLFYIGLFGTLGAWARYGQTVLMQGLLGRAFPFATFSINIIGSFLMGFLVTLTLEKMSIPGPIRTGMLTGGLGAYTTFSTFSFETYALFQAGHFIRGAAYVILSLAVGVLAVILGVWLAQR